MGDFDVAVRGGTVVTAADVMQCDIGIRDGRIAALADRITGAKSEIDATGLLVMPGGIDSHVHLCQNSPGIRMADDFTSGSMAAVAGGNTTIIPFATQPRGASLRESVTEYQKLAEGNCIADYGIHLIITDPTPSILGQELPALVADGHGVQYLIRDLSRLDRHSRKLLDRFF